jgi:hypothetical protein
MNDRIDRALQLHDATDQRAEEGEVGRAELLALQFAVQPMRFEFSDHGRKRRARNIHLVERLHGAESRGAALVRHSRPVPAPLNHRRA